MLLRFHTLPNTGMDKQETNSSKHFSLGPLIYVFKDIYFIYLFILKEYFYKNMQDVTGRHESFIFYHYRDMTSRDRTTEESIFL